MAKLALIIEYNGSCYQGFQFQAQGATIQGELEKAINRVSGEVLRVAAASRTDSGVHAQAQVACFRTNSPLLPAVWVRALNYYLPPDIAIKAACTVPDDFDVRGALSREYSYTIITSPSPLKSAFAYLFPHALDAERMNQACSYLQGDQDLASFTPSTEVGSTVRRVFQAQVHRENGHLTFTMVANAFLPHQIRHTAGSLLQVGRGKVSTQEFGQLVAARKRGIAGPALPACGLCLVKVTYPQPLEEM